MRASRLMCGLACLALVACTERPAVAPTEFEATFVKIGSEKQNFNTHLTGDEEVPPNASKGQGQARFQLNEAGTELSYQLIVANIENVIMAHIHLGARGVNGPVVVWLYPGTSPPAAPAGGGRIQGRIASGTITAANLTGPLAGQPLSALIAAMRAGNTYVNVHTNDGVPPSGTGPGDLPGGEIRGQIRPLGPKQ